jgi:DNA-directed RNA polymerase specialized sigma24 family protein
MFAAVLRLADRVWELEAELGRRHRPRRNVWRDEMIVVMHDGQKLSFGQIAKKLGMTTDAVRKAYKRAKLRAGPPRPAPPRASG